MSHDPAKANPDPASGTKAGLYAITVAFEISPDVFDRFVDLVRDNAATSLRLEPKCHRFDVLRVHDLSNRRTILLYEIYADRSAFEAHLETPHFQAFDHATQDMIVSKHVSEFLLLT